MKKILIRLDDITPDMNWGKFERIQALFEKYHIRPILGVVPDNRDSTLSVNPAREEFWEIMRTLQEKGWTIAQHGYRHTYVTKKSGLLGLNPFSEFAGLPFAQQKEKLAKGQEILHKQGICAKMFMAPGHTYDRNTLRALKELGFTAVTDGYSRTPYHYRGLDFIPCTLSKPKPPAGVDTLCLHINHMTEEEFTQLERFLDRQIGVIGCVQDILGGQTACEAGFHTIKSRTLGIAFDERKNLLLRRIKRFAATNAILQQYMAETDSENSAQKKKKRILGLPGLFVHVIFHWNYK